MSNNTKLLSLVVEDAERVQYGFAITPLGLDARTLALNKTKRVLAVTSKNLSDVKVATATLKGIDRDVENARVEVKEPFLERGREVDRVAKEFVSPIKAEIKRLEDLIAVHVTEERKKADAIRIQQEQERQRQIDAERQRIREEQAELARIEREKEEAERKARDAKSKAARERAAADAKRLQEESDRLEIEAAERQPDPLFQPLTLPTPDTSGTRVDDTFEVEVTNVAELYKAFPQFVTLTPKKGDLLAFVKLTKGLQGIPGVSITHKTNVRVRI